MKIEAAVLLNLLETLENIGYSYHQVNIDNLSIDQDIPKDKLNYHAIHLIKEGYLEGNIVTLDSGQHLVSITRITDKGNELLKATENPVFLEWVKSQTGNIFGDLLKGGVKGGASLAWELLKQWLSTNGI